jgi:hypothetical protein
MIVLRLPCEDSPQGHRRALILKETWQEENDSHNGTHAPSQVSTNNTQNSSKCEPLDFAYPNTCVCVSSALLPVLLMWVLLIPTTLLFSTEVFYRARAFWQSNKQTCTYARTQTGAHMRRKRHHGHRHLTPGQATHLLRLLCSPWLTWVRHLSMLTLAMLPAHTASLAGSSELAQTSWLECLRTYSISPYPSLLSSLASRYPQLFLYPRKQRQLN